MPLQSFALSKSELDAYQVLVLDKRIDRPLIVTGCAGRGKSVLAIHKAKELKDQGYSLIPLNFLPLRVCIFHLCCLDLQSSPEI